MVQNIEHTIANNNALKVQIFAEQIRLLYDNTLLGCITQAVIIVTLALAQKDYAPHSQITAILAYFAIIILFRLYLNYLYNSQKPTPSETQKWAHYFTFSIGLTGLGWLIAAYIFITSSEPINVIFTALVLGGISVGALISLASHLPTYYALLIPTMLSGIVLYLQVGTYISYYTAAFGVFLTAFLLVSAKNLNAMLLANIALKFEYKFLFSDLVNEKKTTDLLNENLKSEIRDRRRAEEKSHQAMEHAETANQAKTEFLSSMSHELRTPLNAIMGFSQLLEHHNKDPKHAKYITEIMRGGRHLLTLISQVLDLAKIERGQLDIIVASASPEEIIKEALAMVEIQAHKKNIKLDFHQPKMKLPDVKIDQTRALQVMLNILSNAIKYNVPNGQVSVTTKEVSDKSGHQFVRITISDTGIGIPVASHPEIFEAFNRLAHHNSNIEGSGIGLSICKNLMELMGGKIDFQSSEGDGSIFWIDLPLATASTMPVKEMKVN